MSNLYAPFRYDYVGSFLRPAELKKARRSRALFCAPSGDKLADGMIHGREFLFVFCHNVSLV